MYVYVIPAQTKQGVYPLGGDARYLISQDGSKIVEKRQLYISILEFTTPADTQKVQGGYHINVLDDIPEDTDVFHVLNRKPSVPELVVTRQFVYGIETDGTINYFIESEEFLIKKVKAACFFDAPSNTYKASDVNR